MGVSSNTLHLKTDDEAGATRAYGTMLRRRGWRLRVATSVPHYLETHDEPVFRRVVISRPMNGWITIIDQRFDEQHLKGIDRVTGEMSVALRCPALAMVVHDSEAMYLFHWDKGKRLGRWCSWPGWYDDGEVPEQVKERWRGHPERLLPLCRPGVSEAQLSTLLRDYSSDGPETPVTFPETVLCALQDTLAIEGGPRTYASQYDQPSALYLALPGAPEKVRIDSGPTEDGYWDNFRHLHFVRL